MNNDNFLFCILPALSPTFQDHLRPRAVHDELLKETDTPIYCKVTIN